jgi:hypothetical protein
MIVIDDDQSQKRIRTADSKRDDSMTKVQLPSSTIVRTSPSAGCRLGRRELIVRIYDSIFMAFKCSTSHASSAADICEREQ